MVIHNSCWKKTLLAFRRAMFSPSQQFNHAYWFFKSYGVLIINYYKLCVPKSHIRIIILQLKTIGIGINGNKSKYLHEIEKNFDVEVFYNLWGKIKS